MQCPECGHVHQGAQFAYICIGCPCPETPGRDDARVLQVEGRPWYVHGEWVVDGVLVLNGWWLPDAEHDYRTERCYRRADTLEVWEG